MEPGLSERRRPLSGVPEPVTVQVPAKINLHLSVGRLRPDGYHGLTTVFQAVSLLDELTASPAAGLSVAVTGPGADDVPTDGRNLALRAATALAQATGTEPAVHLDIHKGIPVAGGMAGGSADAAAALIACDALWRTGLDAEALAGLAAGIGSDVPFALHGGTALGTGRGEVLTPVLGAEATYWWVLVLAHGGLSTPRVYAELDRQREQGTPVVESRADAVLAALRSGDPVRLGRALANDLQPAALQLRPALRDTLAAGLDRGALGAVVSGSGPTTAFLAGSRQQAEELAAALAGHDGSASVQVASGPVPGARLLTGQESP